MRFEELVSVSRAVAETGGRLDKVGRLARLLSRLDPSEIEIAVGFLTGWPRQGRMGVGWAALRDAQGEPSPVPDLTLADVDRSLERIKEAKGRGSARLRLELLRELFAKSTAEEQQFVRALVIGEVRQGALEGVLAEAVARAARVPADRVRRAAMLAGDLGRSAAVLLVEGEAGLARWRVELFRPVQPMLADSASDVAAALEELGRASLEYKLDGARIQVHKSGDEVAVYSRSSNPVTAAVPEVVAAVRGLAARELILDGEVLALRSDGRPHPFQVTMRRFGRRLEVESLQRELPVTPFFFDLLYENGEELLDLPYATRAQRLETALPASLRVPRIVTEVLEDARRFESEALALGHEGLMAKSLDAPYAAGRRGSAWLKVKTARTLDLVVLAAEWGSGRRQGWLSNLHLGARDPLSGGFVMLGKTFKGMTDEVLAWQTRELLAREVRRDEYTVYVRPELVVEVAFNEVQASSQYPGGVTLRFARIKGYRPDKRADEADTIDAVRALA
ncbi:MAG: ATP-dependent DNA ligase [Gemmatimonadales bacterium]